MIIALIGKKRSGKDTIAEFLSSKYGFKRYAFADPIKEACREIFGFTEEQLTGKDKEKIDTFWGISPREAFQVIGTEIFQFYLPEKIPAMKKIGRYFWVHRFLRWFKENQDKDIVVSDCRFIHEVDALQTLKNVTTVKTIKITRQLNADKEDPHISEVEIDRIRNVDSMIINSGTKQELFAAVSSKVDKWKAE